MEGLNGIGAPATGDAATAAASPVPVPVPPQRMRLPHPYREEGAVAEALADAVRTALDWPAVVATATPWVQAVRDEPAPFWALESLLREYPISSAEGLSLMRLAEALLRVPDAETAVALTADQLGRADFDGVRAHDGRAAVEGAGQAQRMLASLSSSAIALSKKFLPDADADPPGVLQRLGARTVVAATVRAIQLLGRQFVLGRHIGEAMAEAADQRRAQPNLRFSYDMLGEGARTEDDARRYLQAYRSAIDAIAEGTVAPSPWAADGISIKLSALFSRYHESQRVRVFAELVPRVQGLIDQAARGNLNLTIDAEESDRLELSLDVFESLAAYVQAHHPQWRGFGLAVQAYQTRAVAVVDAVAAIARAQGLHFMVRLVKGAYWDGEIKRAQEDGLPAYPVFTHKHHTDIAYLACAQRLLQHADVIYPQFATHNAGTVAAILQLASAAGAPFELQRLHGMGDGVYREVLKDKRIACRVYAPVGEHRDLLAYLVRRLLENGANSSFVHQLTDAGVDAAELLASPLHPAPGPGLPLPRALFAAERENSAGVDLACAPMLRPLLDAIVATEVEPVLVADAAAVDAAMRTLALGFVGWNARGVQQRAAVLRGAADRLETELPTWCALLVNEGHRVLPDAVSEVREAIDFCRYYAVQAESTLAGRHGRGVFVCISPWNFPLAIFAGQAVAALVAGNAVAAKPAEQTPAVAMRFIALLHDVGVPRDALVGLHGPGETVGAALTSHPNTAGVCFTGSTPVARAIRTALANRDVTLTRGVAPLIAETGGLNAMIVDSTALPEQVVDAVVQSAFRSAGQRCSALRLLVVHASVADVVIAMLAGAMQQLRVGEATCIDTDVGPVIDAEASANLQRHLERLQREATLLARTPVTSNAANLVAPVAFELARIGDLHDEVFGPVLHVVRWRGDVDAVVDQINALGYGLTLGVQTRIDGRALRIARRARVGNVYVNRNMVGAVVGVQPFGGEGLSGSGPKAGGPNYLKQLTDVASKPARVRAGADTETGAGRSARGATDADVGIAANAETHHPVAADTTATWHAAVDAASRSAWPAASIDARCDWLQRLGREGAAASARRQLTALDLPGPTGETNQLRLHPRGVFVAVFDAFDDGARTACEAVLVTGNTLVLLVPAPARAAATNQVARWVAGGMPRDAVTLADPRAVQAVLEHDVSIGGLVTTAARSGALSRLLAQRAGAIVPLVIDSELGDAEGKAAGRSVGAREALWRLCVERTLTINTAAAGGNAALLTGVPSPSPSPTSTHADRRPRASRDDALS